MSAYFFLAFFNRMLENVRCKWTVVLIEFSGQYLLGLNRSWFPKKATTIDTRPTQNVRIYVLGNRTSKFIMLPIETSIFFWSKSVMNLEDICPIEIATVRHSERRLRSACGFRPGLISGGGQGKAVQCSFYICRVLALRNSPKAVGLSTGNSLSRGRYNSYRLVQNAP